MTPNEQCREMLARWDRGESIWSVEMGGLGPGYEQAIQVLVVEIIRDNIDSLLPDDSAWRNWGDSTVTRIDKRDDDGKWSMGGFSGAQVGAAKNLAYHWLKEGPDAVNAMDAFKDRKIQVSNHWPRISA